MSSLTITSPSHTPTPCPACGATKSRVEITARDFMLELEGDFYVSRCAQCGLLFQSPRIASEALAKHYPDSYAPYVPQEMKISDGTLWNLKHRRGYNHLQTTRLAAPWKRFWGSYTADIRLLPDYVPGGRLLEIGCASGARLSLLRNLGWSECMGIEPSESAADNARSHGFKVVTGKVEDALVEIPDASLDVIIAGFVMEHLENPFVVTRALAAKLKPNGQFLFSTLNIGSPDFHLYGKYWYNLDLPRHHVFFRKRDLRTLVEKYFRIEGLTYIAAPNDYVGSARYRARHAPNPFDRLLSQARNRILPLCLVLARLGLASRVALRCRKISNGSNRL